MYNRNENIYFVNRTVDVTKPITEETVLNFLQKVSSGELAAEGYGSGLKGKLLVIVPSSLSDASGGIEQH
jgi:hypothetical protein